MPSMNDLREAGIVSALEPVRERLTALNQGMRETQEVEELTMQIAAVSGARFKRVAEEAERRSQVFADAQASSTHVLGSPKVAALRSVLDDLVAGRYA